MEGVKRSHDFYKNRHNGKVKDNIRNGNSSNKIYEPILPEIEGGLSNLPIIKQADNVKLLPRYTAVLGRNVDEDTSGESVDGVKMKDLDQLQQDLERLLSVCALRHRILRAGIENMDQKEERRETKKGKSVDKQPPLKRKKVDDRIKYRESKNGIRFFKQKHYNVPLHNNIVDLQHKEEIPRVTIPKNDTSDKFWLSIEPYCADVTRDDLYFLDELLKECSQEIQVKIPEIGEHYTLEWLEEIINQEQSLSTGGKNTKNKSLLLNNDLKKNGLNAMIETLSSPFTESFFPALIEEKVITKLSTANEKSKEASSNANSNSKSSTGLLGSCIENKIKKEDKESGKLNLQNNSADDDILQEIKKCQQELEAVNSHNVHELKKLKSVVEADLKRQEVKADLDQVDSQVLEMYNKILVAKQKQIARDEDESFDKTSHHKPYTNEFELGATDLIERQVALIQEYNDLENQTHVF